MDWILFGKISYDLALIVSCVFAIVRGGTYEKIGAAIAICASGATAMVAPLIRHFGDHTRLAFLLIDLAVLVGFGSIMSRSMRFWPIWATGFQLAAIGLNVVVLLDPSLRAQFVLVQGKLAYGVLLALALGSARKGTPRASPSALGRSSE